MDINLISLFLCFWLQQEESKSFAVGHFALGYLLSKASAKLLKTNLNIPLALTLSVIPDIDILIHILIPFLQHRGPTHSIIASLIVFIPIFVVYRVKAVPYFIALIQHSLVGDYTAGGGSQMLWPITMQSYGMDICMRSLTSITMEWVMFLVSAIAMLKAKDVAKLLRRQDSNLILTIPTFTVLLPTFLAFPSDIPPILVLPHVAYLILFLTSILMYARKISAKHVDKLVTNRSIGT